MSWRLPSLKPKDKQCILDTIVGPLRSAPERTFCGGVVEPVAIGIMPGTSGAAVDLYTFYRSSPSNIVRAKNSDSTGAFKIPVGSGDVPDAVFPHPGQNHGIICQHTGVLPLRLSTPNDLFVR